MNRQGLSGAADLLELARLIKLSALVGMTFGLTIVVFLMLQPSQTILAPVSALQMPVAARPVAIVSLPPPPQRLTIPRLGIDAPVEAVGLTQGAMDVPKNPASAGWFDQGPRPGQQGNVAFDGHVELDGGGKGIFTHLNQLKPGDRIQVTDSSGTVLSYVVRTEQTYNYADAPMNQIFGPSQGYHLNIITCAGSWSRHLQTYTQRLVVYTDLVK